MTSDPTQRFSNRAEHYVRGRPGYPEAIGALLEAECGLGANSVVADIGSGTGIFSELLLEHGCRVFGIEPNPAMRATAERLLGANPRFSSRDGTAESTGLEPASVDLVTAAQAFHWFDSERARLEFTRILRADGWMVLVWNERRNDADALMAGYERLLVEFGTDYDVVRHMRLEPDQVRSRLHLDPFHARSFTNLQSLDLEGLRGRVLSTSYVPAAGHPRHAAMLEEFDALFREHQRDGVVTLTYDCVVYFGRL